MKSVFTETRKLLTSPVVLIPAVILLLIHGLLTIYFVCSSHNEEMESAYAEASALYYSDRETFDRYKTSLENAINERETLLLEYMRQRVEPPELQDIPGRFLTDADSDITIIEMVLSDANRANEVRDNLEQAIKNAERQLPEVTNLYERNRQIKLINSYQNILKNLQISGEHIHGWDSVFQNLTAPLCLILFVPILALEAYLSEIHNGMRSILKTTKKGRYIFIFSRVPALFFCIFLFTILLEIQTVLYTGVITGFSTPNDSVQVMTDLRYCPYALTLWEAWLFSIFLRIIAGVAFLSVISIIANLTRNYIVSISFYAIIVSVQSALALSPITYNMKALQIGNYYSCAMSIPLLREYQSISLFGCAFSIWVELLLISTVLIISIFPAAWYSICTKRVLNFRNKQIMNRDNHTTNKKCFHPKIFTLSVFEWYKIRTRKSILLLTVVFVFLEFLLQLHLIPESNDRTDRIYHDYMTLWEGEITHEKLNAISEERLFIDSTIYAYDNTRQNYENGQITLKAYSDYLNDYYYAISHDNVLKQIEAKALYLYNEEENTYLGDFVYDTGWRKLSFSTYDYPLALYIVILSSALVGMELKDAGLKQMIRTTAKGRLTFFKKKIRVCILTALLSSGIAQGIQIGFVINLFDIPCLTSPLQSIESFSTIGLKLNIIEGVCLILVVRLVTAAFLTIITSSVTFLTNSTPTGILYMLAFISIHTLLFRQGIIRNNGVIQSLQGASIMTGISEQLYLFCLTLASTFLSSGARFRWVNNFSKND